MVVLHHILKRGPRPCDRAAGHAAAARRRAATHLVVPDPVLQRVPPCCASAWGSSGLPGSLSARTAALQFLDDSTDETPPSSRAPRGGRVSVWRAPRCRRPAAHRAQRLQGRRRWHGRVRRRPNDYFASFELDYVPPATFLFRRTCNAGRSSPTQLGLSAGPASIFLKPHGNALTRRQMVTLDPISGIDQATRCWGAGHPLPFQGNLRHLAASPRSRLSAVWK